MKSYLILGLLALLFTHAISAVVEAQTTVALKVDGLASIAEKSTEAVASFPRAPSAAVESITKRSANDALTSSVRALATPGKGKCVHNAPGWYVLPHPRPNVHKTKCTTAPNVATAACFASDQNNGSNPIQTWLCCP